MGGYYYSYLQPLEEFGKRSKGLSAQLKEKYPRFRGLILERFLGSDEDSLTQAPSRCTTVALIAVTITKRDHKFHIWLLMLLSL
jgi:hypothetical protein